jgi:hypothetical protein
MSGRLPGVSVKTMDRLEPDGYEISVSGQAVGEGRVSASSRYIPKEALHLLGSAAADGVPFDEVLIRLPRSESMEPLGELLTMSADEVVARRVEKIARADSEIYQDPNSSSMPHRDS